MEAVVHDNYDYITYCKSSYESEEEKSHAMAKAVYDFPSTNNKWVEITVPFEKTGYSPNGQMYIIVNLATNAVPAKGQEGDHLYIDDIELVYPEVEPVVYDKYIGITVNGVQNEPVAAPIEVTYNDDNTIDFNLKNFCLQGTGVGNITLPGLAMDEHGHFTFKGDIQITAGDKEGVNTWVGPLLGEIPVDLDGTIQNDYFYVHIDISMADQVVEVEAGDLATATVRVSDALVSTFCAPFTYIIPTDYQSYVTASTITSVNSSNALVLEPVEKGVIPANTPVVIEIPMSAQLLAGGMLTSELPVSGIYVEGTPTAGLLTGVYKENTYAPVGSYVLQNISGKVGFYQVADGQRPKVGVNRCYLTTTSSVKAFYFDEDDATSINEELRIKNEESAIYNLAGQRMSKMQKGINIINGKKILK